MTSRLRLPNRRPSETIPFNFGPLSYYGTVSYYGAWNAPDFSRPAELFISCSRTSSDASLQIQAAAIAASFALQYGCPADTLLAALPKLEDGSAAEPLGHFLKMVMAE